MIYLHGFIKKINLILISLILKILWKLREFTFFKIIVNKKFKVIVNNKVEYHRVQNIKKTQRHIYEWYKYIDNGDTIYDIGANVGLISIMLANRFPDSRIYSFEPIWDNIHLIKKQLAYNDYFDRVFLINCLLSNKTEISKLKFDPLYTTNYGQGITNRHFEEVSFAKHNIFIPSYTIDDLILKFKMEKPKHLKIDVDGNESKILEGSTAVLSKYIKSINLEYRKKDIKMITFLNELTKKKFKKVYERSLGKKDGILNLSDELYECILIKN